MDWCNEYVDLAEFYDKNSSFQEKCACLDALRDSLPSDVRNLNTAWMSWNLPRRYATAWEIIKLIVDSSCLSEFWLKAAAAGKAFSRQEFRYLALLLLIYRFKWLYEWLESDEAGLDAAVGFDLSRFLSDKKREKSR